MSKPDLTVIQTVYDGMYKTILFLVGKATSSESVWRSPWWKQPHFSAGGAVPGATGECASQR